MFDVGFSEIVVIAVVALVVIGPERLPKAARTLGHLFGRLQRYVNDVKSDINREIELDELRKLQREVQTAATELKTSVESAAHGVESGVREVERDLNAAAAEPSPRPPPPEPLAEPVALPNEPGGELADAAPAEPPRQPSLPGFDKI
ncbi:MAG: Sec-independent protein translocase protein TatB [Burkholderiales bacterium]